MAQRGFDFSRLVTSQCDVVEFAFVLFFRSYDAHNNQACDDVMMIEHRHNWGKVSEGQRRKKRRQSEEEKLLKKMAGRWNETARYFVSLWFVLLTLALFVTVYVVVYGVYTRQCMYSSKLEKANDITKGGVGRDKRDTASGARQLCVLVVWRYPFDDAKAPRSNYSVLFSLFSFYSVFLFFLFFQSW